DGRRIAAKKGVICSVTPQQLYDRLLREAPPPEFVNDAVAGYRYGKGNMQIHYALSELPQWSHPELGRVALIHLSSGLDGVSKAANECERGILPSDPTICVGQPIALDPTRCPAGNSILWIQLPETPRVIKGDASNELPVPEDGRWTEALREAYADRVERQIKRHIRN
ncbi:dehydrogenase, partial [Microbacteriaceae bacterium K1510]|nr:dehydrogenase [Microbacteriaceae bacterium K1510]